MKVTIQNKNLNT